VKRARQFSARFVSFSSFWHRALHMLMAGGYAWSGTNKLNFASERKTLRSPLLLLLRFIASNKFFYSTRSPFMLGILTSFSIHFNFFVFSHASVCFLRLARTVHELSKLLFLIRRPEFTIIFPVSTQFIS
jgi:hypothetical protein